jgi:uncharacterized repeat protein (TIGR02543 family)
MKRIAKAFFLAAIVVSLSLTVCACGSNSNTLIENITNRNTLKTVTFVTNGGTSVSSQTVEKLSSAPKTTKKGSVFDGWFLDETLTRAAVFPLTVSDNMTLYARWLKTDDTAKLTDCSVKMWTDSNSVATYLITPSGFDLDRLDTLGYSMEITVTFYARYVKDYNALWDIGYNGAPGYEVYITNSDLVGTRIDDEPATTASKKKTLTYSSQVSDLKNNRIKVTFGTDNMQNTVYFENITVTYHCYK